MHTNKLLSSLLSAMLVFTLFFYVEYKNADGQIERTAALNIKFVDGGVILHDDTVDFTYKQSALSAKEYRPGSLMFIGSLRILRIDVRDIAYTDEEKKAAVMKQQKMEREKQFQQKLQQMNRQRGGN